MHIDTALTLIEGLCAGPFITLEAVDHTKRFEDGICVTTIAHTVDTSRGQRELGWPNRIDARANFCLQIGRCYDAYDLYNLVMRRAIVPTIIHEQRELFRVLATDHAPFHPHRQDGMDRWGEPDADLGYGLT